MQKIKILIKNNGIYFMAFLIPWTVILVHSLVYNTWVTGNGSLLRGDTGMQIVQLFYELWDKVHGGESLFYSWDAYGGFDFYVNASYYLCSPFTLIVLALPRTWIYNTVQFIMVLKLSLASVTMVYFFCHTRHNTLKTHKRLVSLFLGLAWGLSNGMINFMGYLNWTDVMILFPLLLLLVEKMVQSKAWRVYYILLTLCMLYNFYISYHIGLFLLLWFFIQIEDDTTEKLKKFLIFAFSSALAVMSGMVIILPAFVAQTHRYAQDSEEITSNFVKSVLNSIPDVIESFFIFDSKLQATAMRPYLYISIIGLLLALLFLFVRMNRKKKIYIIAVAVFMTASLFFGFLNVIWHGFAMPHGLFNRFVNVYTFLMLFMALQVLIHLEEIRLRYFVLTGIIGLSAIVITFFKLDIYQTFYVYLATVLLFVLYIILLVFFKRKSITYQGILMVIAIFGISEIAANGYLGLTSQYYDVEPFMNDEGERQIVELTENLDIADGERIAYQTRHYNWGMVAGQPAESGFLSYNNGNYIHFNEKMGVYYGDSSSSCNGGSPLLNLMFNIRYVVGNSDTIVSDAKKKDENNGYYLYETERLAGLGYMVNNEVEQWDIDSGMFFELQNTFVKKSVDGQNIFTVVNANPSGGLLATSLDPDPELAEQGVYLFKYTTEYGNAVYDYCQIEFVAEEDMDLYMLITGSVATDGNLFVDGNAVYLADFRKVQCTYHVGDVKKGQTVTYIVYPQSSMSQGEEILLFCQFAKFNEEAYAAAYDKFSKNVYQIDTMEADYIKGSIYAEEDGVMMTSIQAVDGFTVLVDGAKTEYKVIGGCMMGIPLTSGEHTVEFIYRTPYVTEGLLLSLFGVVIFIGITVSGIYKKKNEQVEE